MIKYLSLITVFTITQSCLKSSKKYNLTANERQQVFSKKYLTKADTSLQLADSSLLFIKKFAPADYMEFDTFRLFIFKNIDNEWQQVKDSVFLVGFDYRLDSIKLITLSGKQYLYYEEFMAGGSMGNFDLKFTIHDVINSRKYFIHYIELPEFEKILTEYRNSEKLEQNSLFQKYLQDRVNSSSRLYRPK